MLSLGLRGTEGAVCDQCTRLVAKAGGRWDGKNPGGNIEGLSTPENDNWRAQTPARKYREDATTHYVLAADLYLH